KYPGSVVPRLLKQMPQLQANGFLTAVYRCPEKFACLVAPPAGSASTGYFSCGPETPCYGKLTSPSPALTPDLSLHDASTDVHLENGEVRLSFDPGEVITNLRHETYMGGDARSGTS